MSHSQYSGSSNPQGGGGGVNRKQKRRPRRSRRSSRDHAGRNPEATNDAVLPSVSSGITSDPRRNRDWGEEGGDGEAGKEGGDLAVVDNMKALVGATDSSDQLSTQRTETSTCSSTFVSLGSNSNVGIDTETASSLFQVASLGSGNGGGGVTDNDTDQKEEADSLRGDNMPKNWHWQRSNNNDNGNSLKRVGILGSIQESRRSLSSSDRSSASDFSFGRAPSPVGLLASSNRSSDSNFGLSSLHSLISGDDVSVCGSVESSGSGKLWDRMESNRHRMEATDRKLSALMEEGGPLSRKKRTRQERRRKIARRCVRAVVVVVGLATLSISALYLAAGEGWSLDKVLAMLPSLFLEEGSDLEDSIGGRGEVHGQPRYRVLPQDVVVSPEMAPPAAPPPEDSRRRELNRRARVEERGRKRRQARAAQRRADKDIKPQTMNLRGERGGRLNDS